MPSLNHTHTYVKYKAIGRKITHFKCDDPKCTHFADSAMVRGKASLCTECRDEFIMDSEALKRARPTCVKCSNTEAGQRARKAEELVKKLPAFMGGFFDGGAGGGGSEENQTEKDHE